MVVLWAYSGSFWIACHSSAHSRSVRRMPSRYSENVPECAISMSCSVIHSRLGASWRMSCRAMYTESSSGLARLRACAAKSSTDSLSSSAIWSSSICRPASDGAYSGVS